MFSVCLSPSWSNPLALATHWTPPTLALTSKQTNNWTFRQFCPTILRALILSTEEKTRQIRWATKEIWAQTCNTNGEEYKRFLWRAAAAAAAVAFPLEAASQGANIAHTHTQTVGSRRLDRRKQGSFISSSSSSFSLRIFTSPSHRLNNIPLFLSIYLSIYPSVSHSLALAIPYLSSLSPPSISTLFFLLLNK